MIQIVWEFHIRPGKRAEFEQYYGAEGQWARLFGQSAAYRGTTLVRDMEKPERYLVSDRWADLTAFQTFKQRFRPEYEELDRLCEQFTQVEQCLGTFEIIEAAE